MNDLRVGRIIRAVRRRLRLTQQAVSDKVGIDRSVLSDLENGRLEVVSLRAARRLCGALGIDLVIEARWRGGAVDRLLDQGHAAIVEYLVDLLTRERWIVEAEFTFNDYGDRGSVDLLAWQPGRRALLIVEVKTSLTDLQAMLMSLSRKVRVVPRLVAARGWRRDVLGRMLVVAGTTANRSVVRSHQSLFDTTFPAGSRSARAWLRDPAEDVSALWFVSDEAVRHSKRRGRRGVDPT